MSDTLHTLSVDQVNKSAKRLAENYTIFVRHAPKMLRQSMMLAYTTAIDDMLMAMDSARVDSVKHPEKSSIVLLDQNGNAS